MLCRGFILGFALLFVVTGCTLEDAQPDQGVLCAGLEYVRSPNRVECRKENAGECWDVPHLLVALERKRCPIDYLCNEAERFCYPTCATGEVLCDGRCINPSSHVGYCGAKGDCQGGNAGQKCTGGQFCANGQCGSQCSEGETPCVGDDGMLVCIEPQTDNKFCGARADDCASPTRCAAGEVCSEGQCGESCVAWQLICDGRCVNPKTHNMYCGASGDCSESDASRGTVCTGELICIDGSCACSGGQVLCSGTCIDSQTSLSNCGARGFCTDDDSESADYEGETCKNGKNCVGGECLCPEGWLVCDGICIDPKTDASKCGAKVCVGGVDRGADDFGGEVCKKGESCVDSVCECPKGRFVCDDICIDPKTNGNYCGARGCDGDTPDTPDWKGETCRPDQSCVNGECACPEGQIVCGSGNGSCIDPQTEVRYCGAKGSCSGGNPSEADFSGVRCGNNDNGSSYPCVDGACRCRNNTCRPGERCHENGSCRCGNGNLNCTGSDICVVASNGSGKCEPSP